MLLISLLYQYKLLSIIAIVYGFWPQIKSIFIVKWLQCVGCMALTSYLLQTLICTAIFYHLFFAYFYRLQLLSFVPLIWLINILFAISWLKYFSQGPM
ncbi:MAG: DUF418 domain-containing protein [Arsenophonus endosymbiont of Dermacentor nuttalli]